MVNNVRKTLGPVACFKSGVIVNRLPKTRSGKIARNTLKAMLNRQNFSVKKYIEWFKLYLQTQV